jgi:hypothetical protein
MVKQEICYVICKHTLLFLEILQTAPNYLAYRRLHLHTVLQTKLFAGVYSKNYEKRVFLQTGLFYGFWELLVGGNGGGGSRRWRRYIKFLHFS